MTELKYSIPFLYKTNIEINPPACQSEVVIKMSAAEIKSEIPLETFREYKTAFGKTRLAHQSLARWIQFSIKLGKLAVNHLWKTKSPHPTPTETVKLSINTQFRRWENITENCRFIPRHFIALLTAFCCFICLAHFAKPYSAIISISTEFSFVYFCVCDKRLLFCVVMWLPLLYRAQSWKLFVFWALALCVAWANPF